MSELGPIKSRKTRGLAGTTPRNFVKNCLLTPNGFLTVIAGYSDSVILSTGSQSDPYRPAVGMENVGGWKVFTGKDNQ